MIKVVEDSIKHFFEDILKAKITKADKTNGELYGASIPLLSSSEGEYSFYLFFPVEILHEFQNIFLKDSVFKEDDLCDLSKEFANQIIGHAKIVLNQTKNEYKLGIPEYLGKIDFSKIALEKELIFTLKGNAFRIGYKKV